MALSASELIALNGIFGTNGWPRTHPVHGEVYESLCAALDAVEPKDRALLVSFTSKFGWYDLDKYMHLASLLVQEIAPLIPNTTKRVISVGMVKPSDFGKQKSAPVACYVLRPLLERMVKSLGMNFDGYDRPDSVPDSVFDEKGVAVVMVDDYVGSGTTAEKAARFIKENRVKNTESLIAASLVGHKKLSSKKKSYVDHWVSAVCRQREIREGLPVEEHSRAYEIMDTVGKALGVPKNLRLGFGSVEALVCMVRCPNNTFPFYWFDASSTPKRPFLR